MHLACATALIWLSIILMPVLNALAGSFYDDHHVFFILETACVMAFAVSFILKGHGRPSSPGFDQAAAQPSLIAPYPPPSGDTARTAIPRQPTGRP